MVRPSCARAPRAPHVAAVLAAALVAGCSQVRDPGAMRIERAADLGLVSLDPATPLHVLGTVPETYSEEFRNRHAEHWMAMSDHLCRRYKDHIIQVSRDTRLGTDVATTLFAGLATIFTPVQTIRPLAGAATITSGIGSATQTNTFQEQTGEVLASAIETARANQANQISSNLTYPVRNYSLFRAYRDVVNYHNMCSLETALAQIRASLRATSPDGGRTPPAAQGTQTLNGAPDLVPRRPAPPPGVAGAILRDPNAPLPAPPVVATFTPGAGNALERAIPPAEMRQIQAALCVTPADGAIGPRGSRTRQAILQYLAGRRLIGDPATTNEEVDVARRGALLDAVDAGAGCGPGRFLNAYEVGAFGVPPAVSVQRIRELQSALRTVLGGTMQVPDTGQLDAQTRRAIAAARLAQGLDARDGPVDARFHDIMRRVAAGT